MKYKLKQQAGLKLAHSHDFVAQLKVRDKCVFTVAGYFDIVIAWNLAGGYQIDSDFRRS